MAALIDISDTKKAKNLFISEDKRESVTEISVQKVRRVVLLLHFIPIPVPGSDEYKVTLTDKNNNRTEIPINGEKLDETLAWLENHFTNASM
ncbi:hypothetical protein [Xylocopilactobacillus apicola]|uniref:Uncharacterized protein n=1 Tax=Xylocopilactobacillus apicola TaxID=2932184 RepID=A0AAU9DIK6_9LACO|nr:hypothetical protein [Xylocopilactobacillus apicola]BDR58231.1 hypothetical protein XA3_06720 [Xylocopilactobacillus apicola]